MFEDVEQWTSTEVGKLSRLLHHRIAQLEQLLGSLPIGIAVYGADGRCSFCNRAFRSRHSDSTLAPRISDLFAAVVSDRQQIPLELDNGARVGLYPYDESSLIVISTAPPKPLTSSRNGTEPRRFCPADVDLIGAPVLVISDALDIIHANRAAGEFLGHQAEDLISASYRSIDPSTPGEVLSDRALLRVSVRHKSGAEMPVEVRVSTASTESGRCRVLTLLPVSESALPQAAIMPTLERVSGQVAHRLNNLLTVILSYTELLAADYGSVEALGTELDRIREAASLSARITQDLLTFSRGRPTSPVLIEVDRTVAGMASLLRGIAEDVSVRILLQAPGAYVRFSLKDLEALLLNIVRNAKEAIGDRAGTVTIQTSRINLEAPDERRLLSTLGLSCDRGYVKLVIADTGSGFTAEHQALLFEPFFTTKPGALGMGLPIAYGLLKQAGGAIVLQNQASGGTKAILVLPESSPTVA